MSLLHRRHKSQHDDLQPAQLQAVASEQTGQQQAASRVPRRRSSGLKFFASSAAPKPESPKESHKTWEAEYLKDLRANRPARPGGSRPLPTRAATSTPEPYIRASSAMSFRPSALRRQTELTPDLAPERSTSALSHRRAQSYRSENIEGVGRPAVRQPTARKSSRDLSASTMPIQASSITPSATYRESGMRWMEKQEARSLREALEDMDIRDEARVHAAAQDEASELVWKHRNKDMPKRDPFQPYNYKQHLEKGAHARSQSFGWCAGTDVPSSDHGQFKHSVSGQSASKADDTNSPTQNRSISITFEDPIKANHENDAAAGDQNDSTLDSPKGRPQVDFAIPNLSFKAFGRRRSSGLRARNVSGGLFRNPGDKIYEEPDNSRKLAAPAPSEQSRIPAPLTSKNWNASSQINTAIQPFHPSEVDSADGKQRTYRSEIQRNPPSQSRNPVYLRNQRSAGSSDASQANEPNASADAPLLKDGKEIRSDDIKAATSMRMKDRSPKLPSPTVVSNRPGRPIVSFDQGWKPKDADKPTTSSPTPPSAIPSRLRSKPPPLESTVSAPAVPTINIPDPPSIQVNGTASDEAPSIPEISVSNPSIPSISLPDDPPTSRPLPAPSNKPRPSPANRPLPHHSSTTPVLSSKLHWSPSSRRATAQCAACALPIEGRIVSAASQRFHPGCFTCHHCAEALECVAFYPEPDSARDARLARIEARANGTSIPAEEEEDEKSGETALEDGDPSPRFYCHLDFHELFSPRCRSCKTPIETEVVLACGASWHVGHFFCAQCGDPFDAKTPFVEKDGYAWCVGCHAGRFSGKCKGCRKPVVEGGVVALGGEWHVDCFCCVVSAIVKDE